MSVGVIIAAAGRGLRLGGPVPKQLIEVGGRSLLTRSIDAFCAVPEVSEIVVVVPEDHVATARAHVPATGRAVTRVVTGGPRRQDSVALGRRALSDDVTVVLVHDAARAFVTREVIERTIEGARQHGAAIAAVHARDTIKRARDGPGAPVVAATLPRDEIFLAQTPQGFRREVLEAAIALGESGVEATDEATLAELAGFEVALVEGDPRNLKITTEADLALVTGLAGGTVATTRVGFGYDSHRFVDRRPLILGGVSIPHDKGLLGHSDADAVAHAATDAILGAAALGDIGQLFPDTDDRWKDADSMQMLAAAVERARAAGFRVANLDVTVIAERPRLAPHRDQIRANLARVLGLDVSAVNVKGKTNEGLDAIGRGEGMVVHAVALLERGGR